jgi:hypothetical protein
MMSFFLTVIQPHLCLKAQQPNARINAAGRNCIVRQVLDEKQAHTARVE